VKELGTEDVGLIMKANHTCMECRGVRSSGSITTTSKFSGVFLDKDDNARAEFFELI
jgi:GTP cyclohydrolase I